MGYVVAVLLIISHIYETVMVSGIHGEARRNNISFNIGGAFFYFIFGILTAGIYGIYWLYKADECISYEYRSQNKHYRECHPIAWYLFGGLIIVGPFIAFDAIKNRFVEINITKQESIKVERNNTSHWNDTKKCPFCAEEIKKEAIVCRYCGRQIVL